MASLYSAGYTDAFVDVPSDKVKANKWHNRLRAVYDTFALTADLAAGDKIYMAKLPKGARVIDVLCSYSDLDASGGTIDIGYEYNAIADAALTDDLDAFATVLDVATAAASYSMASEGVNLPGFGYEIEGDADIVITTVGDTDATSGTIKLCVIYLSA